MVASSTTNPLASLGVRAIRDQLGLTQEELATQLGVSKRTIFRWEHPDAPGGTVPHRIYLDRMQAMLKDKGHDTDIHQ